MPVHKRVAVAVPIGFAVDKAVGMVAVHMAAESVADSIAQRALDLVVKTVEMTTENREIEAVVPAVVEGVCYTLTALVDMVKMRHNGWELPVAQKVTVAAHKSQDAEA